MFSLMLEIGLDWAFLICANLKSSFSPLVTVRYMYREIHSSTDEVMCWQKTCSQTAILNWHCSFSGQRCQNYNSHAIPGQNNNRVLVAGRARDAAWMLNTTAVPQQGVLWLPQTKVRLFFPKDSLCCIEGIIRKLMIFKKYIFTVRDLSNKNQCTLSRKTF